MHSKLGSPMVAIRSVSPWPQRITSMPSSRHLLAEVERLDDAVDVELPEVEEEDPHPMASRMATACGSPLKGDTL